MKKILNIKMKILKEYKDIDWDDIDVEEDDPNVKFGCSLTYKECELFIGKEFIIKKSSQYYRQNNFKYKTILKSIDKYSSSIFGDNTINFNKFMFLLQWIDVNNRVIKANNYRCLDIEL